MTVDKSIRNCINRHLDLLVKKSAYGAKGCAQLLNRSTRRVYDILREDRKYIARRLDYEYVRLNAEGLLQALGAACGCGAEAFRDGLTAYIAAQERSLWEAMSFADAPSAEELLERIIAENRSELAVYFNRSLNDNQISFEETYFAPVRKAWRNKWEQQARFRAKLYDNHNRLVEVSRFSSRADALGFAARRTKKHPERYSRYVICVRSPINGRRDAVYKIYGGFSYEQLCTNPNLAAEWKVDYYDGADNVILSHTRSDYLSKEDLFLAMVHYNALYGVVSYRRAPGEDFIVQYFHSYLYYPNPDIVDIIEERMAKWEGVDIFADDFPAELYPPEDDA